MKILIADGHTFFREGLRSRLSLFSAVSEIREIADKDSLKDEELQEFDFLFIDRDLLGEKWKKAFGEFCNGAQTGRVVFLISEENKDDIWAAFSLGAQGCLTKHSADAQNINALRLIMDGIPYIPPAVLKGVPMKRAPDTNDFILPSGRKLTARQKEVLTLLSDGLSNKEIAYKIEVSEATVKLHINALLRNLRVENRTKAVVTAQKMGLL